MQHSGQRNVIVTRHYFKARERLAEYQKQIDEKFELFRRDPLHQSLRFHEYDRARYKNWWSYRVNNDIRTVVSDQQDCWVVCYVDHHDDAEEWIKRHRFTLDMLNGSYSFAPPAAEVVEAVVEPPESATVYRCPLSGYTPDQIMRLGVPNRDWAEVFTQATEERFEQLLAQALSEGWFPEEVIERLFDLASSAKSYRELLPPQVSILLPSELFRRRPRDFWTPESEQEIRRAITSGWQEWVIFLHPAQRAAVERDVQGAIRIGGGAGTGKTVVAAHRTAWLAARYPDQPILLTTFTRVLAENLKQRVEQIIGSLKGTPVEVVHLHSLAYRLFTRSLGRTEAPLESTPEHDELNELLAEAIRRSGASFDLKFVRPEWETIIDAWNIRDLKSYLDTERIGRKMPLQRSQRENLWPVFEQMWRLLEERRKVTYSTICYSVAEYLDRHPEARYRCVVVDEAQDFGPAELTLIRALAPDDKENALFLCADSRQRIYRPAIPWTRFNIDTRGRSYILRVNYRTTRQIQDFAESVLPSTVEDVQGEESRALADRPIALMHGVAPEVRGYENIPAEMRGLKEWIYRCLQENIQPGEIAIFARGKFLAEVEQLLKEVFQERGVRYRKLGRDAQPVPHELNYGTAHGAKGLEFRAVAVVGVTTSNFPNHAVIKDVSDAAELQAKENQERQLLYTVCTRAREKLYVSWSPTTRRSAFVKVRSA